MEKKYRKVSTAGLVERYDMKSYPPGFQLWFRSCIQGAMRRDLDFSLTIEQAYDLSQSCCTYCERDKVNLVQGFEYVGLDRIENDKGYTYDNVQPCCKTCNTMKGKMTAPEFFEHIRRIARTLSS
jgi:hypothetical protein